MEVKKSDVVISTIKKIPNPDNPTISGTVECQYQTVSVKRVREETFTATTASGIDELMKKIVPAKSFLYRNRNQHTKQPEKPLTSYVPMDVVKKPKKFFQFSYEYPNFDLSRFRMSKTDNFNDRGYYTIKTTTTKSKTYKNIESRTRYKSFSNTDDFSDIVLEEHFYEDLCYNDIDNIKDRNRHNSTSQIHKIKTNMVKVQDMFSLFKFSFFKKGEELKNCEDKEVSSRDGHIYENNASNTDMYDSVHVKPGECSKEIDVQIPKEEALEEYLEPIQLNRDYCDVTFKQKDSSFLLYIMSIFESRFGMKKETNDANNSEDSDPGAASQTNVPPTAATQKWNENRKSGKASMADRPLPVPVDNEPYFMNVDRPEAEQLLAGHPDGTFILRPSSQPNHAYTLSVACAGTVHNVGIRRRPDGRLALGFPRRGERCFSAIPSLLRYHRRRRLLLVAGGGIVGSTTLKEPPDYYQTPSSLPVRVETPSSSN